MTGTTKSKWFGYLVLMAASALAVGVAATPVSGQGFNFQNFGSVANLQLNGNAAQAGNVLRLTPASTHKVGSAWFTTQQQVQKGFTTVFQFRITNSSPPSENFHADGLAFVIQNSSVTALGGDGSGIGYGTGCGFNTFPCGEATVSGIPDSLAIEFDTFQNTGLGDPDSNHIAVQSCGTGPNTSNHNLFACSNESTARRAITSELSVNLSNGAVHTVVINYDPCTGECSGTLTIFLDSSNTPVLTASVNLSPLLSLGEGGTAFVGFTGSTGDKVENNDILNWSFSAHTGTTTNAILNFTPDQPSQVAKFGCASSTDCTNAGAHSIAFKLKQVNAPGFTIVVSATRVQGDGVCESGNPNDSDFDCRFVTFFGIPIAGMPPQVRVPLCYPYLTGSPPCVYYRVENPPPSFAFQGPDLIYVAWNGIFDPGPNYFKDNPHLYRAPDEQQFSLDITEYYISSGGQVGKDPGVGGESDDFSDFVVAFPQKPAGTFTFVLQPPLPPVTKKSGSTVNIFFQLKNGNMFVNNAHLAPNHLGFAVVNLNSDRQRVQPPGDSPAISFDPFTNTYQVHFKADLPAGSYQVCIDSNLFAQQCIALVLQ